MTCISEKKTLRVTSPDRSLNDRLTQLRHAPDVPLDFRPYRYAYAWRRHMSLTKNTYR